MGIFSAFIDGFKDDLDKRISVDECIGMVEQFLLNGGTDLSTSRADESLTWLIQKGSATIYLKIGKNELLDEVTLEVTSPILRLPSKNILPFYRRCLEINSSLVGCALCASEDRILMTSERTLRGLDYQEVEDMVLSVAEAADKLDDVLSEEFGAKIFSLED